MVGLTIGLSAMALSVNFNRLKENPLKMYLILAQSLYSKSKF